MALFSRGETYIHRIELRENGAPIDPTSIKITITNPCGVVVVNALDMTMEASGVYWYGYDIPADGAYGEYEVSVEAISDSTSIFEDNFIIFPWKNAVNKVRRLSGITNNKSISDDDISLVLWESYIEALDEVFEYRHRESLWCNPATGAWFDGVNKIFLAQHPTIADSDGDGVVSGYTASGCTFDVELLWKDADGDYHVGRVEVLDATSGKVSLTQDGALALPNTLQWAKISYSTEYKTFDLRLFRKAVYYLAAHECILRFHESQRATLADIESNKFVVLANPDRMLKKYRDELRLIRKPVIGAGMLPGAK